MRRLLETFLSHPLCEAGQLTIYHLACRFRSDITRRDTRATRGQDQVWGKRV